ncbi:MAG: hypothetical protein IKH57_19630 [Clostridia bacterium]|nr:hypothetical protein [Clostridia bacterium]MBR4361083.1 hypothetical protein [Clostridia bacterium]
MNIMAATASTASAVMTIHRLIFNVQALSVPLWDIPHCRPAHPAPDPVVFVAFPVISCMRMQGLAISFCGRQMRAAGFPLMQIAGLDVRRRNIFDAAARKPDSGL